MSGVTNELSARDESLLRAVDKCDIDQVRNILQSPCDVNVRTIQGGDTPLIIAVNHGHEEIVRILLKQPNIDVNKRNGNNYSALILAVFDHKINIVKMLVNRIPNLDINIHDRHDCTALNHAINWSNKEGKEGEEGKKVARILYQHPNMFIDKELGNVMYNRHRSGNRTDDDGYKVSLRLDKINKVITNIKDVFFTKEAEVTFDSRYKDVYIKTIINIFDTIQSNERKLVFDSEMISKLSFLHSTARGVITLTKKNWLKLIDGYTKNMRDSKQYIPLELSNIIFQFIEKEEQYLNQLNKLDNIRILWEKNMANKKVNKKRNEEENIKQENKSANDEIPAAAIIPNAAMIPDSNDQNLISNPNSKITNNKTDNRKECFII